LDSTVGTTPAEAVSGENHDAPVQPANGTTDEPEAHGESDPEDNLWIF
jgi:hypothetical protein